MKKSWQEESQKKIIDPKQLKEKIRKIKEANKTIATVNGSFDILHAGHLHILYEGSQQADVFIVALNTDSSIQRYKSPQRPIIPLKYRLEMLAALSFVDYVTYFDETDPCNILSIIKPDVHINGAEYGENCIEKDVVVSNGGRLHIVELKEGLATSQIVERIKQCV